MPCLLLLLALLASPAGAGDRPVTLATIAERTSGLERHAGFVSYFWDARAGQLLLDITPGDAEFLYGSGIAGGAGLLEVDLDRGSLGPLGVCRFERMGPRVLLEQRQTTHRSGTSDAERSRVVRESFASSVLASLPIVAEEGGRVLVDATELLLRDARIAPSLKRAQLGEWRQDRDRSAMSFDRSGAFPRNTELEAALTFTSDEPAESVAEVVPDGHSMTLRLHHSFLALPEPGYEPRRLDPRIGFIARLHLDHTAPYSEPIERYLVARWRLQKREPAAALSEPVEPIVYYLDRGIPEPERSAIREAALWWNHAFEAAGFKSALVLRDLPEGATFLDMRYSGVEWINRADRSWSIGDAQTDPRTGEIVHAVARIDSHRRRTTSRLWQNLRRPDHLCAAADAPEVDPSVGESALVLARLRYLAAHEVGHTLGLEHNWAATTFGWGSVMDYLAAHIELKDGKLDLSDAYPTDVGSYDKLTIRWGYTPGEDAAALDKIVRDGYAQGIVYPLESDPRWAEYDWGADPVAWLRTTQQVRRVILERFGTEQLVAGAPVYDLQARFSLAYLYHRFGIQTAQQFVGGQLQTNALRGDGQQPVAWVPAAKQKEALELLLAALAPENLDVPDRILTALVPAPSGMRPTRERFASEAGEAFSLLTAARSLVQLVVDPLLDPQRAARLSLVWEPDGLSFDKLLRRLVTATWDAAPASSARGAALGRVAQRVTLDALLDLAARPETAPEPRAVVIAALTRLRAELTLRHATGGDAEAHLRLAERDIAEFLDRPESRKARAPRMVAPPGRPIGATP